MFSWPVTGSKATSLPITLMESSSRFSKTRASMVKASVLVIRYWALGRMGSMVGAWVSRTTITVSTYSFPIRSTARRVIVFSPSLRFTYLSIEPSLNTCLPLRYKVMPSTSAVPVTRMVFSLVTVPSSGDVITAIGAVVST